MGEVYRTYEKVLFTTEDSDFSTPTIKPLSRLVLRHHGKGDDREGFVVILWIFASQAGGSTVTITWQGKLALQASLNMYGRVAMCTCNHHSTK